MSKLFISCDEATTICDKNQYGEASLYDKLRLNLHFLRCKICRVYTKQNTLLTKIFGGYAEEQCAKKNCLTVEDKKKLETELKSKLK